MSAGEPGYPDPDDFDGDLYARLKVLPDGKIMDREWIRQHICPEATGELYTLQPNFGWRKTEKKKNIFLSLLFFNPTSADGGENLIFEPFIFFTTFINRSLENREWKKI